MRRCAAVILLLLAAACRTTRPPENAEPLSPLTSTSPTDAAQQLVARRSEFRGERSLIRVRLPKFSARGQLQVDAAGKMLLTIYTPLGTTLARLYVDGNDVVFLNDIQSTAWRGKASDLGGMLGVFANTRLALLLVGLPPEHMDAIAYAPNGIESVQLPEVRLTYDPAVYPPRIIAIDHGTQHYEIEHLESFIDPAALVPLQIPRGYSCCVLPQL